MIDIFRGVLIRLIDSFLFECRADFLLGGIVAFLAVTPVRSELLWLFLRCFDDLAIAFFLWSVANVPAFHFQGSLTGERRLEADGMRIMQSSRTRKTILAMRATEVEQSYL